MLGGATPLVIGHGILAIECTSGHFITGLATYCNSWGWVFEAKYFNHGRRAYISKAMEKRDHRILLFFIWELTSGHFYRRIDRGSLLVQDHGWHYGFGLAGIGMAVGQVMYVLGLKHLEGVGDFIGAKDSPDKELLKKTLKQSRKR